MTMPLTGDWEGLLNQGKPAAIGINQGTCWMLPPKILEHNVVYPMP